MPSNPDARRLLRTLLLGAAAGLAFPICASASPAGQDGSERPPDAPEPDGWVQRGELEVDRTAHRLRLTATLQSEAFLASTPPDHQYHALVHRDGGAAAKALFVTDATDRAIAEELRRMGARDGGGVPMSAWGLRWVPLVPQPDSRVEGSVVEVWIEWEGASRPFRLDELLEDREARGVEIRFGGNEEHDDHWHSGCIVCLYSCPGGVLSNARYSIRDHQRGVTSFEPGDDLPPDGTEVTVTFVLNTG